MSKSSTSFKPGQSGNSKGRPPGSKDAITRAFLDAVTADFEEHGAAALVKARERNPNEYLRVIASILPKDQNLRVQTDEVSERFAAMMLRINARPEKDDRENPIIDPLQEQGNTGKEQNNGEVIDNLATRSIG